MHVKVEFIPRHHRTLIRSFGVYSPFACVSLGCARPLKLALYLGCGCPLDITRLPNVLTGFCWCSAKRKFNGVLKYFLP